MKCKNYGLEVGKNGVRGCNTEAETEYCLWFWKNVAKNYKEAALALCDAVEARFAKLSEQED